MGIPIRIHKILGLLTAIMLVMGLILFLPSPVYAATNWIVTDANDIAGSATDITLRYAMTHAQAGDTINFAESVIGQCYYTTDGTDPVTSSTRKAYDGLIPVSQTVTIKAVNHTSAGWSAVTTATFNIGVADSPREPAVFPYEGSFTSPQTVYIYGAGADWLYYTTDGSDPVTSSTRTSYQGAFTSITVSQSETVKIIAQYGSSGLSNVASASYTIGGTGPLTAPVITPNGGNFSGPMMVDIYNRSGTIYLSSPLPKINKDLIIDGPGAESLSISGNYKSRVFEVDGGSVSISGITVENGFVRGNPGSDGYNGIAGGGGGGGGAAEGGGGLLVKGGTVSIYGVDFLYNQAVGGSGGNGGAGYTGADDYGDGGNGGASDLYSGSTGGNGGIAPFAAVNFGIFQLSSDRPGSDASDGAHYGGGGGGSGINSDKESSGYSVGGQGGQDVNGTIGTGPNGGSYNTNGSKGGNGGCGGAASVTGGYYYGGNGGNGGDAYGGAVCVINGAVQILNSSFTGNSAIGGTGGAGGISYQGMNNGQSLNSFIWSIGGTMLSGSRGEFEGWAWLANFGLSRAGNAFSYEAKTSTAYPFGGYPGNGGNGEGGAIYVSPYNASFGWNGAPLVISNSTFADNGAYGGYPGPETNWTGISGSYGQYFADDIANHTNSSYIAVRNLTGVASTLGDIRTLSGPSTTWSRVTASSLSATADGTTSVTITVNLRDSNNMPVWGDRVTLNQGNGHSSISPASVITDNDGNAIFTVTDTKAETVAYTATDETNVTISGKNLLIWDGYKNVVSTESTVTFNPGPPSAGKSTVSASPSAVSSNGIDSAKVEVTVEDACGNPLSGKTVILGQGSGSSGISPASATTDSNGKATFTITDTHAETVTYSAVVQGDNVTVSQTVSVTFAPYTWVVDSLSDTDTIGTLRYAIENAPAGNTITFKSGINGTIWLSGALPQINKDLTIAGPGAGSLTISGKNLYRVFEVGGGTVTITGITVANGKAAGINGANGSYSASSGMGEDGDNGTDGNGGALLATGGVVSVENVTFSGNSAVGGSGGRGGNPGTYGQYNYWAGSGGNGGSGSGGAISMTGGSLSVINSTFIGNTATGGSAGNGGDASQYSGYGGNGGYAHGGAINVTSGTLTIFNCIFTNNKTSGGNGGNGGTSWNNQHNGYSGGIGGDGYGGSIQISNGLLTITDSQFSDDSITGGRRGTGINSNGAAGSANGLNIFNRAGSVIASNVSFDSGSNSYYNSSPADAMQSTVTASPTDVVSDGTSFSKITVRLKGANGSPLGNGKTVTLSQGSGSSRITPASATTDSSGTVTFTVTNSRAETVTYTARDVTDNVTLVQKAVENFLPPDVGQSTVTASPAGVKADGSSKSMIMVTLKYADGNPAAGKTVTLDQDTGTSVISPSSAITDSNGTANFTVTSIYARTVTYTARDTTDNVTLCNKAAVTFNPYVWIVNTLEDINDPGTLRYAINNAPSGATIIMLNGLTGTITLQSPLPAINKDLTIDGNGTNVTVSGNDQYRVLEVVGGTVSIKDITIAHGKVTGSNGSNAPGYGSSGGNGANGSGGGLLVMNGNISIENVYFNNNNATGGQGGSGNGTGRIWYGGTGGSGLGGAICLNAGSLVIINSRFDSNSAIGGQGGYGDGSGSWYADGGSGGNGYGGAVYFNAGSLSISNSQFDGNQVAFGNGGATGYYVWGENEPGSPGRAVGGDMYVLNGTTTVSNVTFDPGNNAYHNPSPADAGQSVITASAASVESDGITSSTITVTLKLANGNTAGSGKVVTLQQTGSSNISPAGTATTDAYGTVTFTVTDTRAETVTYTAKDTTDNVTLLQSVLVTFIPPDAGQSTVTTSPTSVTANGSDEATITVILKHGNGNPAAGRNVTLSQGTGSSNITPVNNGITDSNGTATFIVTDVAAETVIYTAKDMTDNITVVQNAAVTFKQYSWIVNNLEDDGSLGTLRYAMKNAPSGTIIAFDGALDGIITLKSQLPAIDKDLTIDGTGASITISGDNLYRVFEVDGGMVSIKSLTVTGGKALGSTGWSNTDNSGGDGSGGGLLVNNGTVSLYNVTFKDNNAIGGQGGNAGGGMAAYGGSGGSGCGGAIFLNSGSLTITDSGFSGNSAIGSDGGYGGVYYGNYGGSGGNGGNGYGGAIYVNTGSLTISNSGFSGNVVAFGNGGDRGVGQYYSGNPGIHGSAAGTDLCSRNGTIIISNVSFGLENNSYYNMSPVDEGQSTVTAGQSTVASDGSDSSIITVKLKDANGSPIGDGKSVTLIQGTGNSVISPSSTAITDSFGTVTFTVTDNRAEKVTYMARDTTDNVTVIQTAAVTFLPPDAGQSTVTASPTNVTADGIDEATITVTLKHASGKTAAGRTVILNQGTGSSKITTVNNGVTNSNGTATFKVTDTKPETVTYTAADTTDNMTVTQTASVTFLASDAGQSTVVASPASVPADGATASTITVRLYGQSGKPVSGKTVVLSQSSGSSSIIETINNITDSNGTATFKVADKHAETVTYTATDTTDNITVTQAAEVTFSPYTWAVNTLEDGSSLGTLRYAVKNAPQGTVIRFQGGLNGTLLLSSPLPAFNNNLVIDGSGASVTISGNNQFRIFQVDSGTVTIKELTIADGNMTGGNGENLWTYPGGNGGSAAGGGLLVNGGTVTIDDVSFNNNHAAGGNGGTSYYEVGGSGGSGFGGAIYVNGGALSIINSRFNDNRAIGGTGGSGNGGSSGGSGFGGAIYVNAGSLMITDSIFAGCIAAGGNGGSNGYVTGSLGAGKGSDIYNHNGVVTLSNVTFDPGSNSYYNFYPANAGQSTVTASSSGMSEEGITTFTITVSLKDINGSSIGSGKAVTLTPDKGSSVITPVNNGLTDNSGKVTFVVTDTVTETVTYTATDTTDGMKVTQTAVVIFDIATFTLTYTAGDHGSITGITTQTVKYGNKGSTVAAVPDTGYHFVEWSDGLATAVRADSNVKADINVTAVFAADTFTLSYTAGGHGSITGKTLQTVNYGERGAEVEAMPDTGYHFISWSDGSKDNTRTDGNVARDINVTANFAKSLEILTLSMPVGRVGDNYSSTLEVIGGDMPYVWSAVGLPDGLEIETVTGEVYGIPTVSDISTATITVTDYVYKTCSIAINIEITPDSHFVSVSAVPAEAGTVSGGGEYEEGASVTVKATANSGYGFVDWTGNGTLVSTINPYTFTLGEEDRELSANFELKPTTDAYKVTADKAALTWDIIRGANTSQNSVTSDLNLTVIGAVYGSTITWSSDNTAVISNSGVVTRPAYASGDANVKVTATVYNNGVSDARDFSLTVLKFEPITHTVTFKDWDETILKTETVNEGSGAAAPDNPTRTGYTFTGWDISFNNVTDDLTVTALYRSSRSRSRTPKAATPVTPSAPPVTITETQPTGNTTPSVTGTTTTEAESDSNGKASAAVSESQMTDAVSKAVAVAAQKGENAQAKVEIKVNASVDAKSVETIIPKAAFNTVADSNIDALTISTSVADITFDGKTLSAISNGAEGDVNISAARVDSSTLAEETKQTIGDRPVFDFSVTSGDKAISQFGGGVSVSIPFTPKPGEDTNAIVIYYINAEGRLETVSNCHYEPATGKVTFTTNHFSQYAVGYNKVSFMDVAAGAWYSKAVGFIAARGITTGTGSGNYSPEAKLTRGEFLVLMMRAYSISPDTNPSDNFADADSTYYTGYLAAAKRLGISGGIGNNLFAPDKDITRKEMFTLMYNALKTIGALPEGNSGKTLSSFSDAGQVDSWAKDAMMLFTKTGTIGGRNGRLAPEDTTTRAEMAQVLYNLLSK